MLVALWGGAEGGGASPLGGRVRLHSWVRGPEKAGAIRELVCMARGWQLAVAGVCEYSSTAVCLEGQC